MAGRRRTKVVAEITLSHISQLATDLGCPVTEDDLLTFLNEDGHAYAMWMCMMQAGEEFIKSNLSAVLSKGAPPQLAESAVRACGSYFSTHRTSTGGISDLNKTLRI